MTPRTRDTWLLIAGLPGVVAVFVPVASFFSPFSPASFLLPYFRDLLHGVMPEVAFWFALPVLLPMAVSTLQLYRLVWGAPSKRVLVAALTVTAILTAACFAWQLDLLRRDAMASVGQTLVRAGLTALTGANLVWLYRNLRVSRPLAVTTELLMLGTYLAVMPVWLAYLLRDRHIGPWLIFWTCLAYLVTIVVRWRNARPNMAASDATASRAVDSDGLTPKVSQN